MSDFVITRASQDTNELIHYGVLGMKWGVRKDPAKAYVKATSKQQKLDENVYKTRQKYLKKSAKANSGVSIKFQKKQAKADKLQAKADKKKYGIFTNAKKAAELQVKADRAQYKANKYKSQYEKRNIEQSKADSKYKKAQKKAERWTKQMNKTFEGYDVSKLSERTVSAGETYVKKIA